jgi:hypothetical protein
MLAILDPLRIDAEERCCLVGESLEVLLVEEVGCFPEAVLFVSS